MSAIEPGGLEVMAHLPGSCRVVLDDEARRIKTQILDGAFKRARSSAEYLTADVPHGMEAFARRLSRLEDSVQQILDHLQNPRHAALPIISLILRPQSFVPLGLDLPGRQAGAWIELKVVLPSDTGNPVWALGEMTPERDVRLRCIAQDHADQLVRYLLHRQRLDQAHAVHEEADFPSAAAARPKK